MAGWRLARSLERLRAQIDERFPGRNKASDGTIGDAAHRSRNSDHNPNFRDTQGIGIVSALDLTHDPARGMDTWAMAEHLRQQRDPRIKYVISNKRIFSSTTSPFSWRRFTGSNPHTSHIHISVNAAKAHYDDTRDWDIAFGVSPDTPPWDAHASDPDSPALRPILRRGSTGEDVQTVQRILMLDSIDGQFGPLTEAAVRAFQRKEKLAVDGIVGAATWRALDRIEQRELPDHYDSPRPFSEPIS